MELPLIGITMGDPAGVGPEVIVKALSYPEIFKVCRPVVLGDSGVISRACHILHMDLQVKETGNIREENYQAGHIHVFNLSNIDVDTLRPGRIDERFGKAIVDYIRVGTRLAMEGKIKAVTTAPINKELLHKAGYAYAGHTELLAELTNTRDYVMMLSGQKLKVALVTTHCRLNDVGSLLDVPKIHTVINLTNDSLRKYFAIPKPRIAVSSLNPHGGEGGIFGDEEEKVIAPAVKRAQDAGINAEGPLPADTLFYYAARGDYDTVVCMYHDQALIPLKMLSFQDAVNITLGLPVIRTSVDHGTAYDIAGTGKANAASLKNALTLAASMVNEREKSKYS